MNGYELSRGFFNWCFENPEKVSPNHIAIYFFAIEHCNRLGWKQKFGFPTQMAMDAIGIKKHQTYIRYFNDLVDWKFFILVQKSQNQYSSNIISINTAIPKNGKAMDKANINHAAKQTETNGQSNSSINKPQTNKQSKFVFVNALINYGAEIELAEAWMAVRKTKEATNTEKAFKLFIGEVEKSKLSINKVLEICVKKDWKGFNPKWLKNEDLPTAEPIKGSADVDDLTPEQKLRYGF